MVFQLQRYLNATKAYQALELRRLKTSKRSTPSRSWSSYAISNALQGKAYLLHDL
jgi:hypothetical protein